MSPAPREPLSSGAGVWEELRRDVDELKEALGAAPNAATGEAGHGLQMVLAREVAQRQEQALRAATYRGALAGFAAALPTLVALLTLLRAVGVLR